MMDTTTIFHFNPLAGRQQKGCRGKTCTDEADTRPTGQTPANTGEGGTQTTPDEESGHEDGVHTVGSLRQLPQAGTRKFDTLAL